MTEACAAPGVNLALFYGPEDETRENREAREKQAAAVCARCPVRSACLQYAVEHRERYGVWGGLGENARACLARAASTSARAAARAAAILAAGEKPCTGPCGQTLPLGDFGADPRRATGLTGRCSGCLRDANRSTVRASRARAAQACGKAA